MKMNSKILGIIILVVFIGGIALASALGWWNTEGGTSQIVGGGNGTGSGESSEEEMIRGRTTFQEALDYGLSQDLIEATIGGPIPNPTMRIKTYCDENGLDFEIIKETLDAELAKLNP